MTVCIAAIYGDGKGSVLVSDRMVTAHFPIGYEFEHQEDTKIVALDGANAVHIMIAGDVLRGNEVLNVSRAQLAQYDGDVPVQDAAEIVRQAYQKVRLEKIVHQELGPVDNRVAFQSVRCHFPRNARRNGGTSSRGR